MPTLDFSEYKSAIRRMTPGQKTGRLTAIHGLVIEASGCDVHQGELVEILQAKGNARIQAEVVGLRGDRILLMPFSPVQGLCLNSVVIPLNKSLNVPAGESLLGRVIDPLGEPFDNKGPLKALDYRSSFSAPINPLHRIPIQKQLETGVKAIDIFCPLGMGQRIGIFAGSGVGKSTLLGMMAQHANADIIVICLIGERGREVGDFLRDSLGENGLHRAVVIVATAEQPAVVRRQAAFSATSIAEWFRSRGNNVLLIMDSITRFAMAQREIGLSTDEPIGTRGYPASVFSMLPPLLERGGAVQGEGSITSVYTVLVEGDDMNEPISDHMRSILDGHIVLSRELASRGHYPAIDIQNSISRLVTALFDESRMNTAQQLRNLFATYASSKDLIDLGAYETGNNVVLDTAIKLKPKLDQLLTQRPNDFTNIDQAWKQASLLVKQANADT